METTILLLAGTAGIAFAAGWLLKQNRHEASFASMIESMNKVIDEFRIYQFEVENALHMHAHINALQEDISTLTTKKEQKLSQLQEIEEEYNEKWMFVEKQRHEAKENAKNTVDRMKERSKAFRTEK